MHHSVPRLLLLHRRIRPRPLRRATPARGDSISCPPSNLQLLVGFFTSFAIHSSSSSVVSLRRNSTEASGVFIVLLLLLVSRSIILLLPETVCLSSHARVGGCNQLSAELLFVVGARIINQIPYSPVYRSMAFIIAIPLPSSALLSAHDPNE